MKTRIVFSLLSFLIFSVIASSDVVRNEGPVGQIRTLEGTGMIKRASGKIEPMTLNELIYSDDELTVNGASRAVITLRDNSSLSIGEKATLKVDGFVYDNKGWNKYAANPWLPMKGALRFVTGKVKPATPAPEVPKLAAHIGVRG